LVYAKVDISPESLTFANIPFGTTSEPQKVTVTGLELFYPISYEITGTDSELFAAKEVTWFDYSGGILNITFTPDPSNPNPPSIYTAKLTVHSAGATPQSVNLKGSASGVAIDEWTMDNGQLKIYPNPTTGQLMLRQAQQQIENGELKIDNVEICDVFGRRQITLNSELSTLNSIDISHLPIGIYFVRVQTEEGVVMRKIIKQ
jgi:hypothetical protein